MNCHLPISQQHKQKSINSKKRHPHVIFEDFLRPKRLSKMMVKLSNQVSLSFTLHLVKATGGCWTAGRGSRKFALNNFSAIFWGEKQESSICNDGLVIASEVKRSVGLPSTTGRDLISRIVPIHWYLYHIVGLVLYVPTLGVFFNGRCRHWLKLYKLLWDK